MGRCARKVLVDSSRWIHWQVPHGLPERHTLLAQLLLLRHALPLGKPAGVVVVESVGQMPVREAVQFP